MLIKSGVKKERVLSPNSAINKYHVFFVPHKLVSVDRFVLDLVFHTFTRTYLSAG